MTRTTRTITDWHIAQICFWMTGTPDLLTSGHVVSTRKKGISCKTKDCAELKADLLQGWTSNKPCASLKTYWKKLSQMIWSPFCIVLKLESKVCASKWNRGWDSENKPSARTRSCCKRADIDPILAPYRLVPALPGKVNVICKHGRNQILFAY